MEKFNVKAYIQGCRLIIDVIDGTPDVYQVLFNTDTEEITDIVKWNGQFINDLESDGIYKLCLVKDRNATLLNNGNLRINGRELTPQELVDAIGLEQANILGTTDYESEEIFCMCKLKKCLIELQKKIFQEMLKNCGSRSCKSDEYKSQRDFLFIAVWLLEHLVEEEKWEQVRNLYNSLKSCGSICDGMLKSNKCGCNG